MIRKIREKMRGFSVLFSDIRSFLNFDNGTTKIKARKSNPL